MKIADVKEGQTYVCIKADTHDWTKGKEYDVVLNKFGEPYVVDDNGSKWKSSYLNNANDHFKLKDKQSKVTMEDLKAKSVERKYTLFDVNKVILRAYNMYDNDAQRLAFIKGYFAK